MFERLEARFAHTRIHRQPKIVVGAAHDHLAALVGGDSALVLLERDEKGIVSRSHRLLRLDHQAVATAFVEQVHGSSFRVWMPRFELCSVPASRGSVQRGPFYHGYNAT